MTTRTDELLVRLRVEADQALRGLKQVENQTKATTQEFGKIGRNSRRVSSQLQNAGYQIQDFAVQVSSGTDAMRAFSQQAPQLLSAFGGIGIAVGTAVAVLAPLAKSLFDSGEAAEKATKELASFDQLLNRLTSGGSLTALKEGVSEVSEELREWAELATKGRVATLNREISELAASTNKYLAELNKVTEAQAAAALSDLPRSLQSNRALQDRAKEFAEISAVMDRFGVQSRKTATEIAAMFKAFDEGALSSEALINKLQELASAGTIDVTSIQELIDLQEQIISKQLELEGLESDDPLGLKATSEAAYEAMTPLQDYWEELQKYADTVKRAQDPTIEMVEKITLLKDAHDAGLLSLEQYNKEMGNIANLKKRTTALQDALDNFDKQILGIGKGDEIKSLLEELQTEAGRWADQFANTLVSGLAEGKLAFKDFANYVLEQLARIAISKTLEPLFEGFGNWIGSLGGASAPTAAGLIATPVNDLPLSREATSAQQMIVGVPRMSAPSSSGSPVTVNVYNQGSNEVEVNERKTTRGVEVDVLIKNAVKKGIAAGDFDKVMATSYGARRMAF